MYDIVNYLQTGRAKGFASSLTTAIFYILTFLVTKVYLNVVTELGLNNTFFMFAALSFVGLLYLWKYMPETENKTLLEIEEFFVPKCEQRASIESPSKPRQGDL